MGRGGGGTDRGAGAVQGPRPTLRADKWLFHARFFKTRGLAAECIGGGHLRVNGQRAGKASFGLGVGDTLTFPQGGRVRLIRVLALSDRRGPAPEAQLLYLDLDAPAATPSPLE